MTSIAIPGPRPMPVVGHRGNLVSFAINAVDHLSRLHARYGEVAALTRGRSDHVCVFSPRYNRILLGDCDLFHNLDADSSPVRMGEDSSLRRLYAGLTNMNGPRHRRQRKLMGAALHRRHVEGYADVIAEMAERHVSGWGLGDEVDVLSEMRELTMTVAIRTLLGLDPYCAGQQARRLVQDWMDAVFSIPALALPLNLPGTPYHRLQVLSVRLESCIRDIIASHRTGGSDGSDVLSRLAAGNDDNGTVLTDDELVGQTAFLFMAGHATTASALTWTVFLLAAHPDVLQDLVTELTSVLGGEPPAASQLGTLLLLDRVVRESLRLLPPVMWWSKVSTVPIALGPYRLDSGSRVVFSPYITHRLPDLFSDPQRFYPDRWLTCDPGPYEFLPFSAGPRTCLGVGLATMEIKIVLAVLLQRWSPQLRPAVHVDLGGLMVSQPRHGLPVTLKRPPGLVLPVDVSGSVASAVRLPRRGSRASAMTKKSR